MTEKCTSPKSKMEKLVSLEKKRAEIEEAIQNNTTALLVKFHVTTSKY
jgi:hypothetical protein